MDGSAEPAPGMIIFFDWDDENGQDGLSDHTGIVEKVENGRVYTIEGNSGMVGKPRTATLWGIMRCWAMAAQIFNNLKKKKPSRAGGWVHRFTTHLIY